MHADALGSVRAVTDEGGAVVRQHEYLPFGEEWLGPTGAPTVRFTGKEYDNETGLYYFGARYYRADIGRFTTIDPVYTWKENLEDPQRWNRYAYVRNNPLKYTDPDGRVINLATAAGGAALGGVLGFVGSAVSQYVSTGHVDLHEAGRAAVGGAVSGGLAGLTFGVAPVLATTYAGVAGVGAVTNMAGGAVARGLDPRASTKVINGKAALVDAAAGVLGGAGGKAAAASLAAQAQSLRLSSSAWAAEGNAAMANGLATKSTQVGVAAATRETVRGTAISNVAVPAAVAEIEKIIKRENR